MTPRTINQEDTLPEKLRGHGIQLPADSLLPESLSGHDESATNVPVLDEALTVANS